MSIYVLILEINLLTYLLTSRSFILAKTNHPPLSLNFSNSYETTKHQHIFLKLLGTVLLGLLTLFINYNIYLPHLTLFHNILPYKHGINLNS